MLKRYFAIVNFIRIGTDVASIAILWNLVYFIRFYTGLFDYSTIPSYQRHLILSVPVVIIMYLCRLWVGIYESMRIQSAFELLRKQIESIVLGYLFVIFFLYYSESVPYTRVLLLLFFIFLTTGLLISQMLTVLILRYFRSKGYNQRFYGIIGTGKAALKLLHDIRRNSYFGLQCLFFIDDKPQLEGKRLQGIRIFGDISKLPEIVKENKIDEIYLAKNGSDTTTIYPLLEELQCSGITVRILPDWSGLTALGKASTVTIGSSVLFASSDCTLSGANNILKSIFDRMVAFILLCLFCLPMLVIAILVKLSSKGPFFYKQKRVGMDRCVFEILKFRTMETTHTETPGWTVKNDPRRTRIGTFLRSTSLDELPQLINVIKGEMSLVGPRPEQPHYVEKFSEEYKRYMFRHKVKSGMTGWAQIHGFRGDTSLRKRIQYDIYYIRNWSVWLDILILIRTPFQLIKHKHEY